MSPSRARQHGTDSPSSGVPVEPVSAHVESRLRWIASTSSDRSTGVSEPTITWRVASAGGDRLELLAEHLRCRPQEAGVEIRRARPGEPERHGDVRLDGFHLVSPERRDVERFAGMEFSDVSLRVRQQREVGRRRVVRAAGKFGPTTLATQRQENDRFVRSAGRYSATRLAPWVWKSRPGHASWCNGVVAPGDPTQMPLNRGSVTASLSGARPRRTGRASLRRAVERANPEQLIDDRARLDPSSNIMVRKSLIVIFCLPTTVVSYPPL